MWSGLRQSTRRIRVRPSWGLSALVSVLLACGGAMDAYRERLLSAAPPSARGGVTAVWMGVNGLYLSDGESGFFIDPFVSRYGLLRVATGRALPPREDLVRPWIEATGGAKARAVIVTHSHYDHAMDAPFFARETGALLVGSTSTALIGRGAGLEESRIRAVRHGDCLVVGSFRVRFLESRHTRFPFGYDPAPGVVTHPLAPPAPSSAYRQGAVFALVIEHPTGVLVHHGSADAVPGMYRGMRCDVLLLAIPGPGAHEPYLHETVGALGPRLIVPIHCDNFFNDLDPRAPAIALMAGVDIEALAGRARELATGSATATLAPARSVLLLPRR